MGIVKRGKTECFYDYLKNVRFNSEYTFLLKQTWLSTNMTLKEIRYGFNIIIEFVFLKIKAFCPTIGVNAFSGGIKCPWLFPVSFSDEIE